MTKIKPATIKLQVDQLWEKVIGNGADSLTDLTHQNAVYIQQIQIDIAEIKGNVKGHTEAPQVPKKVIVIKQVMQNVLIGAIVIGFAALVFFVVARGWTPEDIARILEAWRG